MGSGQLEVFPEPDGSQFICLTDLELDLVNVKSSGLMLSGLDWPEHPTHVGNALGSWSLVSGLLSKFGILTCLMKALQSPVLDFRFLVVTANSE